MQGEVMWVVVGQFADTHNLTLLLTASFLLAVTGGSEVMTRSARAVLIATVQNNIRWHGGNIAAKNVVWPSMTWGSHGGEY
jgi:hypothetical protein